MEEYLPIGEAIQNIERIDDAKFIPGAKLWMNKGISKELKEIAESRLLQNRILF